MKVLIGVDPHKALVAVAAVNEDAGELLECASFPQNQPCWPESPRTLGQTVWRASLGGGERWWPLTHTHLRWVMCLRQAAYR